MAPIAASGESTTETSARTFSRTIRLRIVACRKSGSIARTRGTTRSSALEHEERQHRADRGEHDHWRVVDALRPHGDPERAPDLAGALAVRRHARAREQVRERIADARVHERQREQDADEDGDREHALTVGDFDHGLTWITSWHDRTQSMCPALVRIANES